MSVDETDILCWLWVFLVLSLLLVFFRCYMLSQCIVIIILLVIIVEIAFFLLLTIIYTNVRFIELKRVSEGLHQRIS